MTDKYESIPLNDNKDIHHFEMTLDSSTAFIDYKLEGTNLTLIHTEVPEELEGKGVAASLVQKTLTYAKEHSFRIIPRCTYVISFLKKHPEWQELVK